jgi:hypothetical protein
MYIRVGWELEFASNPHQVADCLYIYIYQLEVKFSKTHSHLIPTQHCTKTPITHLGVHLLEET